VVRIVIGILALACIAIPASAQYHSADTDGDYIISLSELLRVIQFFNSDGFHCQAGSEDGYAPGPGDTACVPHSSDYTPQNWRLNLSEVVRTIQLYNSNGYHTQCHSEDTFAPGPGPHEACGGEQYTLTYSAAANGSISGSSPQTVVYGGSGSPVTAIPDPHYHFVQWSDGRTDNPRTDVYVRTDITVTALFATGGIVYVAQGGTGDGSSWDLPLGSIQAAIDLAQASDEIWVAEGVYTSATNPVVTMKEGVAIYGGFAGTETGRDEREWNANITIIDGENARRCVVGADTATLDGFTIAHGHATYNEGGGMYNYNASPNVTNCTFTENSADYYGGGMYNYNSSLVLTNCTIMENWAFSGGGMYNFNTSASLINCIFAENSATEGGGMFNVGASPSVTNCIFTKSSATEGGGMYNSSSSPVVTNCTFTKNSAEEGGGMFNNNSSSAITNCTFTENSAVYRGGGMYINGSASPSVTNCTFTGNSAYMGGCMYNVTGSPRLTNCILWGDSSEFYTESTSLSVTYSCVQGGYPGDGNINTDPLFVDGSVGSIQLLSGSPCVGTGTLTGAPFTDILGRPRPMTGGVTMGAYEGSVAPTSLVHLTIEISPTDWGAATCPAAGSSYTFAPGDYAVIMAKPGASTYFVNWSGAATGIQPVTIIQMDTDKTVTANFVVKPYVLIYTPGEHGSISGSSPQAVDYGDSGSSVTAVPDPHYHFVRWNDGRTDNPRMDTGVISNITVTASFATNGILYVMQGGIGDGSSWESPLGSIQAGINAAASDKEIWVAAGTYTSTTNQVITMKEWVAVYGGFAGTESEWSERDWTANVTKIDGENTRRCIVGADYATLDGFTITRGYVNGNNGGGGMYNQGDSVSVTNCIFTENSTDFWGGGIYNQGDLLNVTNCTFTGNSSDYYGGGMFNKNASLSVTDCIFTGNSATYGGGMYNENASLSVTNCTFMGNIATEGGGMFNYDSSPSVTNCTFTENSADSYGGGVYNQFASPSVTNCTFTGNSADSCGGGICNYFASLTINNCTFSGNSASYGGGVSNLNASSVITNCTFTGNLAFDGGGMYNGNASPMITNCTFTGNSATWGGGMYNEQGSPTVTNCTFTGNTATVGGGMRNYYGSDPVVTNCILWGDSSEIYNDTSSPSVTYSCVQGGYPGTGNIELDPQFVDGSASSLQLLSGSPCVGAGTATGAPATDILGRLRPMTGGITMGAYEGSVDPASLVHLTIEISPTDWGAETWPAAGSSYAFAPGDYVVIVAKPGVFTHFAHWTDAATGTQPVTVILMDTDKTVTANFVVKPYILIYTAGEHGSISGISRQAVDPGDAGSSVAAVPDPHYHFVQWSDGRTDNPRMDTDVFSNITVTASFAVNGIFYVMQGGTGDGSSWESPVESIQAGIDACATDKEIWVASGTYTSTTNPVITMKEWVAVYGGFAGTESEWIQRNWDINVTIIDGENNRRCVRGAEHATLDGFTITHGSAVNDHGGGMYNLGNSLSVANCTFTGNSAAYCGGGMYNGGSSLVVTNCTFTGNSADYYGGGMYNGDSSLVVTNCTFTGNSADYFGGGGMFNKNASLSVTDCIFTGNSATYGGGMYNENASLSVTNCTFTENSVTESGGGMYNYFTSPRVTNCTFTENSASDYGGGMYNNWYASPIVTNCILWGNSSEIYNIASSPSVTYSCVQGGYSGEGNTDQDPLFVNALDDLRLQDDSPCIDSGTSEGAPATDIEGVARPQGGGFDMGAYER